MKRGRDEVVDLESLPDLTKVAKTEAIIPLPTKAADGSIVFDSSAPTFVPKKKTEVVITKRTREEEEPSDEKVKRIKITQKEIPAEPTIVPVRGNPKVDRCIRCNTFVKKGAIHTLAECDARILSKKNRSGKPRAHKKFRMTDKRKVAIMKGAAQAAAFSAIYSPLRSVEKWAKKKEKRLSEGTKKKLNKVFDILNNGASEKKVGAVLRKFGF